jgi:hypothetical protein
MFALDEAMIEEKIVTNTRAEDKAPKVTQQKGNEAMGPFASEHPDASANGGRVQEQHRPRSDDRKPTGCKICSKEHQVADCERFLAMGLDERVEACKGRYICFKCLYNTSHNFAYCKRSTKCNICSSMTHHTLLHGIKRFQPPPSQASTQRNNPL